MSNPREIKDLLKGRQPARPGQVDVTSPQALEARVEGLADQVEALSQVGGNGEGGGMSAEDVRAIVAAFVRAGTNVSVAHDDEANSLTITAAASSGSPSSGVSELQLQNALTLARGQALAFSLAL